MFTQAPFWLGLAPLVLVFWLVPVRRRPAVLALGGAAVIAWLSALGAAAALVLGAWVWWAARGGAKGRRWTAVIGIAGILLVAKLSRGGIWPPIGFSYLVFRLIHVLAESDRVMENCGFAEFWAYVFFPPMFPAGPIDRLDRFAEGWPKSFDGASFAAGGTRIVVGLVKKTLLCDFVLAHFQARAGLGPDQLYRVADLGSGHCWAIVAVVYLRIYLDMSAYADIAIGSGRLLGFTLMENFRAPLLSISPQDFWRRWHLSLTQWCANYVYMPLVGAWRSPYVPLFASFLVMGLWHSFGWGRVGWALWQVVGISVHVAWRRAWDARGRPAWRQSRSWTAASWVLAQGFVICGYAFFAVGESQPIGLTMRVLRRMLLPFA